MMESRIMARNENSNFTNRDANGGGGWTGASDGTLEERRYYCQNWRADVVAITKSDGTPLEYIRYSPYGEPTVYPAADIDMNGKVEAADYAEWNELINGYGTTAVYTPNITFDDSEDSLDDDLFAESYAANSGLSGKGRLSSPGVGNRIGYAGYQWDSASRLYQVRHRWYFPEIGRWGRRDPAGYVDGVSTYQYVKSRPIQLSDSTGLKVERCERRPETGNALVDNIGYHWWVRTSSQEVGMGPATGGIPGNQKDSPCINSTWNDHSGQGDKPGSKCYEVSGCSELCVNNAMPIGKDTGRWCPGFNDCNTSISSVLAACGCKNKCLQWEKVMQTDGLGPKWFVDKYIKWLF